MCGIFGIVRGKDAEVSSRSIASAARDLFRLSEARGKESAGLAVRNGGPIQVFKQPIPASVMIRSQTYRTLIHDTLSGNGEDKPAALIGHSRLVTNGFQEENENNQPVIADGMVAIHNGIITNDEALWEQFPAMQREFEVDTEVLLRLIRMHHTEGQSLTDAVRSAFAEIHGCASVAILFNDLNHLLIATNNGSLYTTGSQEAGVFVFGSERYILEQLQARRSDLGPANARSIRRVEPGEGIWIDLNTLNTRSFSLSPDNASVVDVSPGETAQPIVEVTGEADRSLLDQRVRAYSPQISSAADDLSQLELHVEAVARLKRCSRCVLPETYPFIRFDENGVCNYCHESKPIRPRGADALAEKVERFRKNGEPDCLVAVSGGRDSIYGLHYMKEVLGMNVVAYTYDWGMVTDLARRNISRICGKLGVEHILVSADINKKRENIKRNIVAWMKRPDLGMIPLFMAGDKHFFYFARQLQKQMGIDLVIWCSGSWLECANFKWYFCGIEIDSGSLSHKLKLLKYYTKACALNPSYFNRSILDTMFGYYSYYFLPRDFLYLYEYLPWDENELLKTLVDEYDWELSSDTKQTWRIGDGTASFYNYIYHTAAGFTENDTFRSEQIRQGMITREEAIKLVESENRPRYESMKWYLSIIGLGDRFDDVIRAINSIPKTYPTE